MVDTAQDVELLKGMVQRYSPTGSTGPVSDYLLEKARDLGLGAEVDEACNVIMTTGNGQRHILFLCHMDTVPGELKVHLDGPILHGRGAVDAKGCLAAAMLAVAAHKDTAKGRLTVVAVPDEEGDSSGVREIIKGERPDFVLVGEPSGWEGITIGYKGAMRVNYRAITDKFHSGFKHTNSAEMAVEFWGALEAFCVQESEAAGGGGLFDVVSANLLSINTTDDGRCLATEMDIDIRLPPGYDYGRMRGFMELNRTGAEVGIVGEEPPVHAPKNNDLVKALIWAIREHEGEPKFKKKTGTSDMNIAAEAWEGVPIVAYGPGDSMLDHSPDERIDVREYRRTIEILKQVIGRVLERG